VSATVTSDAAASPAHLPGDPTPDAAVVPGARSLVRRIVQPLLRLWLRLRIVDEHHLPLDGPVIIASTHQSHADSMALGSGLQRPVFFLGDVRLTRWPVLGPWLPKLGMVPLRRGQRDADALEALRSLLADGHAVVVYPEGSRSRDGRVYRPRSGVARLAADTQVPVVPAAVVGIYEVWPIGRRPRLRGGRVTVRFGPAIPPPEPTPRARRAFNTRLHDALVDLSGAERADEFAQAGGATTTTTETTPEREDAR
jgi:1-acyl-sn-glycerol-3-phosphate acyltransferase